VNRCNIRINGGLLFHIVGHKIIPFTDRLICRAAVVHGGIFLLADKILDAGFVLTDGLGVES